VQAGGATLQSCLVSTLDGAKIASKDVPHAAGSRKQL